MRRRDLENWLNRIWYSQQTPPAWLRALVPLYRLAFLTDKRLKQLGTSGLKGKPIVVIGNVTVGGSGKTPLVIRLCKLLQNSGLRVGVASRGYGRSSKGLQSVTPDTPVALAGDEPLLISQRTGAAVIVANDRCAAADALFAAGVDVVIADDGLQHHRLPRMLEICVVDGVREFGNGMQLPAGPLREPLAKLQTCDYVVINGENSSQEMLSKAVSMQLVPGKLFALDSNMTWRLSQFAGCRVNAVAAISNPERFFETLEQAGLILERHSWPDHHDFQADDFSGLSLDFPIIMTEKDAVKCRSLKLGNSWFLSIDAVLPGDFEKALLQDIFTSVQAQEVST